MSFDIRIDNDNDSNDFSGASHQSQVQWHYEDSSSTTTSSLSQRQPFASESVQKWLKTKGASIADVQVEGFMLRNAVVVDNGDGNAEESPTTTTTSPTTREAAFLQNGLSLETIKASMPAGRYAELGYDGVRHGGGGDADGVERRKRRLAAQKRVSDQRKTVEAARRRQSQNFHMLKEKRHRQDQVCVCVLVTTCTGVGRAHD